jgi:hypothetical protein
MRIAAAAIAILLLALAACGDDDDNGDSSEPTSTATATATTGSTTPAGTAEPTDPSPTNDGPPDDLTGDIIDAIAGYVEANEMFSAQREMTDPPTCEEAVGGNGEEFLGKICIVQSTFTVDGDEVLVNAGIWASDGIVTMVLRRDGDIWRVTELRPVDGAEPPPTALTDDMIAAIADYVATNEMFGEVRQMTDPPLCEDAVGDAAAFAGKVCIVSSTFTVTDVNVLVNAGLWSSDAVLTMVLQGSGRSWAVTEVRDDFGPTD